MHTKRRISSNSTREERESLPMDGLHVLDGVCPSCKTPTLYLNHQTGTVTCVVCDAPRRSTYRFEGAFCEDCDTPHWPNAVPDTSAREIKDVLETVAVPHKTNKHQGKSVKTRFPGQVTPVHNPPKRLVTLTIEQLNEELDAIIDAFGLPDDAGVDDIDV